MKVVVKSDVDKKDPNYKGIVDDTLKKFIKLA